MDKKDDFTLELLDDKPQSPASAQEQRTPKTASTALTGPVGQQANVQGTVNPLEPEAADASPLSMQATTTKTSASNTSNAHNASATTNADSLVTVTLLQELVRLLQPRPFYKRHPILFWGFILCLGFMAYCGLVPDESPIGTSPRLAVVRIEGTILKTEPLLKWIAKIENMESVKGVLLRVDSPGGGAAASQELYTALLELGKKKPIVASMGSTAASGGLMVAMAAEHIVANASTITGSIGVRMDVPQVYKLLETLGIGQETLSTGKFKDVPSVMRALNPEERSYLQGLLQDLYDQFVNLVATSRKMALGEVQKFADGRIFTGKEAQKLGLVDSLGGQSRALAELRKRTGVGEDVKLYEQPKDLEEMYAEFLESIINITVHAGKDSAVFLYK